MLKSNNLLSLLVVLAFAGIAAACGEAAGDPAREAAGQTADAPEAAPGEDAVPSTSEDNQSAAEAEDGGASDESEAAAPPEQGSQVEPESGAEPEARAETGSEADERPDAGPQPVRVERTVPTGTTMAVRLNETLSTERSRAGDPFSAELDGPIVDMAGTVLIPGDAVVRGRITSVNPSGHVGETAVIKLAFESVSFGGESYPLQATVIEAHPERARRTSTTEQAAKVAGGAAAGAILGQVLGNDTESTLVGAAVGAAAGTAIALSTADVDAVLASGSRMVIRLNQPVRVERVVYR